jgi:hypothetical protein
MTVRIVSVVLASAVEGEGQHMKATLLPPIHIPKSAVQVLEGSRAAKLEIPLQKFFAIITLVDGEPGEEFTLRTTWKYAHEGERPFMQRTDYTWPNPSLTRYWRIILDGSGTPIYVAGETSILYNVAVEGDGSTSLEIPVFWGT